MPDEAAAAGAYCAVHEQLMDVGRQLVRPSEPRLWLLWKNSDSSAASDGPSPSGLQALERAFCQETKVEVFLRFRP